MTSSFVLFILSFSSKAQDSPISFLKNTVHYKKNIYNVQTYLAASSEPTGFLFFHERNVIDRNPVGSDDDWTTTCNLLDEFLRSCICYVII